MRDHDDGWIEVSTEQRCAYGLGIHWCIDIKHEKTIVGECLDCGRSIRPRRMWEHHDFGSELGHANTLGL